MSQIRVVDKESLSELIGATKAIAEGDFYRELNIKLQGELGELARYIEKTRQNLQKLGPVATETSEKVPQASTQLSDITKATEEATHKVISITEKIMDDREHIAHKISELKAKALSDVLDPSDIIGSVLELEEMNDLTKSGLIEILTSLSFQDLTGQKMKKIASLVEDIETKILELLISFGVKKGDKEKEQMLEQLKDRTKDAGMEQWLVDAVLKNLGV